MGINYFCRKKQKVGCFKPQLIHIGKKTIGWDFTFRGYKNEAPPLTSRKEWLAYLSQDDVLIDDENQCGVDKDEFLTMLHKSPQQLQIWSDCSDWVDEEGFSFIGDYFS